jgi:hypothetical protein
MREPLTIAVAQSPCVPHDIQANAVTHAAVVRSAGARVVVFPELHRMHIAMLAVDGTCATLAYCKLWLGTAESVRFTAGDKPAVLEVDARASGRLGALPWPTRALMSVTSLPRRSPDTTQQRPRMTLCLWLWHRADG